MSMPFHTATSNIDQHDKPYWVAQGYRAAKLGQTFESMKTGHGGPDRWIKQGFNKYASRLQNAALCADTKFQLESITDTLHAACVIAENGHDFKLCWQMALDMLTALRGQLEMRKAKVD